MRVVVKNKAPPSASVFDYPTYMCSPDNTAYEQSVLVKNHACNKEVDWDGMHGGFRVLG